MLRRDFHNRWFDERDLSGGRHKLYCGVSSASRAFGAFCGGALTRAVRGFHESVTMWRHGGQNGSGLPFEKQDALAAAGHSRLTRRGSCLCS